MCGIVGYIGKNEAAPVLIDGLKRLEYRGYDSAGVTIYEDGKLNTRKMLGRLVKIEESLKAEPIMGISRHRAYPLGDPWQTFRIVMPTRIRLQ